MPPRQRARTLVRPAQVRWSRRARRGILRGGWGRFPGPHAGEDRRARPRCRQIVRGQMRLRGGELGRLAAPAVALDDARSSTRSSARGRGGRRPTAPRGTARFASRVDRDQTSGRHGPSRRRRDPRIHRGSRMTSNEAQVRDSSADRPRLPGGTEESGTCAWSHVSKARRWPPGAPAAPAPCACRARGATRACRRCARSDRVRRR